jgi:hypothetical protein
MHLPEGCYPCVWGTFRLEAQIIFSRPTIYFPSGGLDSMPGKSILADVGGSSEWVRRSASWRRCCGGCPDMPYLAQQMAGKTLADEMAPHPFHTREFLLHQDADVPDLIRRAYAHGDAARFLLVKGSRDYIAKRRRK